MDLSVIEQPATEETLRAYSEIPIGFTATSRLRVDLIDDGLGGVQFVEEPLIPQQEYDRDVAEDERPMSWAHRWNLSRWVLLCAFDGDRRVGGAVVARHTGDMWFLRGRDDMAALWDIRVVPEYLRNGVGRALFVAASGWSRRQGCRWLKIETQNVNVAACRFYAAMGAKLCGIDHFAYTDLPGVVELDWIMEL